MSIVRRALAASPTTPAETAAAELLAGRDWVPVEAGDFMWLRAFCPQACVATGEEPFRYLLYKDVNRHMALGAANGAFGRAGKLKAAAE